MNNNEEKVELEIVGMTCSHCSGSVQRALSEMPGVADVQIFLKEGRAVIQGSSLNAQDMVTAVDALGYKAQAKA